MSKHKECVTNFVSAIKEMGGTIHVYPCAVTGGSISVTVKNPANFDEALSRVRSLLRLVPGGHVWGTDGIGYVANKQSNFVEVSKSVTKNVSAEFAKNGFVEVSNW